jgi:hypothetical protein
VTDDEQRLQTDALQFPMAPRWLSEIGSLPSVGVPISLLSSLETLPPSQPMVVRMMSWEGRRPFAGAPVITEV